MTELLQWLFKYISIKHLRFFYDIYTVSTNYNYLKTHPNKPHEFSYFQYYHKNKRRYQAVQNTCWVLDTPHFFIKINQLPSAVFIIEKLSVVSSVKKKIIRSKAD